jgi:hypothetical protein
MQQYVIFLRLLIRTSTRILSREQWRSTYQGILLSNVISHNPGRDGHKQTNEIPEDIHSPDQFLLHKPDTRTLSLKHTALVQLYCQNNVDQKPLKADSCPSRQNIHCLEWNLRTQYRVHNSPLLGPILQHPHNPCKMHFSITQNSYLKETATSVQCMLQNRSVCV